MKLFTLSANREFWLTSNHGSWLLYRRRSSPLDIKDVRLSAPQSFCAVPARSHWTLPVPRCVQRQRLLAREIGSSTCGFGSGAHRSAWRAAELSPVPERQAKATFALNATMCLFRVFFIPSCSFREQAHLYPLSSWSDLWGPLQSRQLWM